MNKLVYIALFVLLSICSKVNGQIYTPNSNIIYTTCSGTFYDSGGANNNYGNSQNYTVTFCSGNGQPIYLNFTNFNLEDGFDFLSVFAGNSIAATPIGTFSANSPGLVVSANGCITFQFFSDNSVREFGWVATIGCGVPPTPPPTYNITNGSITSCSGIFSDSGGANGNYTDNQNYTFTICPSVANNLVQMNFSSFNLENNFDFLRIYNGPNATSPLLGTYTGTNSPGIVQASAPNVSGCLTFVFTSDASVFSSGWLATINCLAPCQTITSNLISSSPAVQTGGIIRICAGQSVTFNGSGTFSQSGVGATYTWNLGNGTTVNGVSATATYPTVGTYFADLDITLNGCISGNNLGLMVQVASPPVITTAAAPLVLCQGQNSNLSATVVNTPFVYNCTTPYSGSTYLPDGDGVTYSTSIPVNCYSPTQTVQSAADISNICLTMEHSYLGDLSIVITCPNGQSTTLHNYTGGGGTYLGCPLDDPATVPGTYRTYCFTPTATTLLVNGTTSFCGTPNGASINGGNYMPFQPLTNLIGCPLNGNWTISVTDNLNLDNGYISTWDINFNPSIPGAAGSFTPVVVSQGWVSSTGLASTSPTTATLTPTTVGQNCYTYSATNNYGCTTTQVQCITVNPAVLPTFTQLGPYCQGATPGTLPTTSLNGITGTWSSAISTATAGSIVYTFTPTAGLCATPTTMTVFVNAAPIITTVVTNETCTTANNGIIAVTASGPNNGYNVSWTGTSTGNPVGTEIATSGGTFSINNLNAGNYTITVSNTAGCSATAAAIVTQPNPLTASSTATPILCNGGTSTVTVTAAGGTGPYTGAGTFTVTAGTYNYTVTDANGCTATTSVTVTQPTLLTASSSATTILCNGGSSTVTVTAAGGTGPYTGAGTFTVTAGTYNYTVTDANGCTATTSVTVTQPTLLTAASSATPILCSGGSSTVTVTAAGGTGPYTGAGTFTVTAGTYNYTVTDANGCTATTSVTVTEPTTLVATISAPPILCAGATTTITVGASGGTGPYTGTGTYVVTAGTYTYTVTDANGCTSTVLITIAEPAPIALPAITHN
jgi:subtilisin-like proprotein convertase family protein